MIDIVRRTALTVSFALACGIFPAQAAHAAGAAPAANGGGAVVKPYDANEAQLSGGPQAYDDIYESQMNDATRATRHDAWHAGRPRRHAGRAHACRSRHAAGRRRNCRARCTQGESRARTIPMRSAATGPQPYGLGAETRPVYKMPY